MKMCRTNFPTILDTEEKLYEILRANFSDKTATLYEDIQAANLEEEFVDFVFEQYAQEKEHLKEDEDNAANAQLAINVTELRKEGKSIREIAGELGITKSKVERIIKRTNDNTSL